MDLSDDTIPFPQTAEQVNRPQTGAVEVATPPSVTADELRSRIVEQFNQFKPTLALYRDYAERVSALSLEFHFKRFAEALPDAPVEELILAATLDARETPTSLDAKLAQLASLPSAKVKRIIFDRNKGTFSLYI